MVGAASSAIPLLSGERAKKNGHVLLDVAVFDDYLN